ncbi:gliding motility-associated C-terminal domain-containing protein [Neolewinella lacunae]|uniref:Gliding motility-associated C-terminal domain-containing protein n=1 Tax=Neolewinella lacunae TaxID=1517758 RepID=A0A923PN08_9BACT|nr:gliding motility-associated C-terminal domain-containing protein [Neolewinella lacunae]MBC6994218.1 gliding motility-associated C-terminal domain-containing protein [Neolewinella lacunae]MDN3634623.1 gliding motility-associated C-terminal domain-containing protein [Neolewinella lacunae]
MFDKFTLLLFALFLSFSAVFAQVSPSSAQFPLELQRVTGKHGRASNAKMLCTDPNPFVIVSCEGELPNTGDNDPSDGAFMTWTATGSSNLYYSRIYNGPDTFQIVRAGTNLSVYPASDPATNTYTATLAIGGGSSNACLAPGTWTVQVWDVQDADGDLLPDRDANGAIIGCFRICSFDFFPSCPPPNTTTFTANVVDIGCNGGGSISLNNYSINDLYCVSPIGAGASLMWTGPGGFTASTQNITGLMPGTYTVEVRDFYDCITQGTFTVNQLPPVSINCNLVNGPTVFGSNDGVVAVNIGSGTGNYTIAWSGPSSGSRAGIDGNNNIGGLLAGTYTFTVTDNTSGCTDNCMVTLPDPPCMVDFTVMQDALGDVVITPVSGMPPFRVSYTGPSFQDDIGPFGIGGITLPGGQFMVGEYVFTVYEVNRPDCDMFQFYTIEGPDCSDFTLVSNVASPITCGGANDGQIALAFTGGQNPVVSWTGPGVSGSTQATISNLGPGTYNFQIIDDRGCFLEGSHTLTAPPALQFSCAALNETCPAANDGRIGLNLAGGTGAYTLTYTAVDTDGNPLPPQSGLTVANGDTLRNLVPGQYNLQIRDANNCTQTCMASITAFTCPPGGGADQSITVDSVFDATVVNGTGEVVVDLAGTGPWTYRITSTTGGLDLSFTASSSPDTAINLPIDTYRLVLVLPAPAAGTPACCIVTPPPPVTFVVEGPVCDLSAVPTTTNPLCFGSSDGSISLAVTGASSGLTIDWSDDAFDGLSSASNLGAGTYTVIVSDDSACPVPPLTITLLDPPALEVQLTETSPINCFGETTGAIAATVLNAGGMLTYAWSVAAPTDTDTLRNLGAGTYGLTVTDANSCAANASLSLGQPAALELLCSATTETAAGAEDGTITLSIAGGGPTVTLSSVLGTLRVSSGSDTTFTGLPPGTYNLLITDDSGCTATCTAIVNQGGCEITTSITPTQPDCNNPTGSAAASASLLANGAVSFLWSNGESTALVSNLTPGSYSVTATDALGCQANASVSIVAFTDFPTASVLGSSAVCDDGCVDINFGFTGSGPFQVDYTISRNGAPPQAANFTIVASGVESFCPASFGFPDLENARVNFLTVTDANGCARPFTSVVDINRLPPAVGTFAATLCAGDTLTYAGESFHAARSVGDVVLPGASANGCDSTVAVSVTFFAPAVGTFAATLCADDTLTYAGESFHAARTTGDVILPGASANGCDSTVAVSVTFFAPAVGTFAATLCAGDTLTYAGESFHAARTVGDVVLPGASVNGCDSTVAVSVTFFAPSVGTFAATLCAGDTLTYAGEIFHAARTVGDVVLPGASVNGCDSTVAVSVAFFAPAFSALDTTICASDTLTFAGEIFHAARTVGDVVLPGASVNGCDSTVAVSVNFFAPAVGTFAAMLCAGDTLTYAGESFHAARTMGDVVLPGASVNGCDSTVAVSVNFFAPAVGTFAAMLCAGDTLTYAGESFHAARTMGDVVLPGASVNGCDSTVAVSLSFFPQVSGVLDTTICAGTSFTFHGRTFAAAATAVPVVLDLPSVNGCDSLVLVTVRVLEPATVSLSGDGVVCADGLLPLTINYDGDGIAQVELSSQPGAFLSIFSGSAEVEVAAAIGTTVRILSANDGGACPLALSGAVLVSQSDLAVSIDITSGNGVYAVSCPDAEDGAVLAIPTGGTGPYTFAWSNGADGAELGGLAAGSYSLLVTSGRGCQAQDSVKLTAPEVMAVAVLPLDATCQDTLPGLVITDIQGGTGPYVYRTGDGPFRSPGAFPDTLRASAGVTTFALEDANGCLLTQEFTLAPAPQGSIVVTPNRVIIGTGDSVRLQVLTDLEAIGYRLTPGPEGLLTENSFFVAPTLSTVYTVTAIDNSGCTATAEAEVLVDRYVPVYVPNAFSPNEDGRNDLFRAFGDEQVERFREFAVFDRWGFLVASLPGPIDPADQTWGWDGRTADGRLHQPGVYVYSIRADLRDGRSLVLKGEVVLVR